MYKGEENKIKKSRRIELPTFPLNATKVLIKLKYLKCPSSKSIQSQIKKKPELNTPM